REVPGRGLTARAPSDGGPRHRLLAVLVEHGEGDRLHLRPQRKPPALRDGRRWRQRPPAHLRRSPERLGSVVPGRREDRLRLARRGALRAHAARPRHPAVPDGGLRELQLRGPALVLRRKAPHLRFGSRRQLPDLHRRCRWAEPEAPDARSRELHAGLVALSARRRAPRCRVTAASPTRLRATLGYTESVTRFFSTNADASAGCGTNR